MVGVRFIVFAGGCLALEAAKTVTPKCMHRPIRVAAYAWGYIMIP